MILSALFRSCLACMGALLACSIPANAQASDADAFEAMPSFSTTTSLVVVDVVVRDSQNRPVSGLPKERFQLFEDDMPRPIEGFRQDDAPVSVAFVVDSSSSMLSNRGALLAAAKTFANESNPQDHTAVINFCDEVYLDLPFSREREAIEDALLRPLYQGQTRLWDAILTAIRYASTESPDERRVLIGFSDGWDNGSGSTFSEILDLMMANRKSLPIYWLLFHPTGTYVPEQALARLRRLVESTGGRLETALSEAEAAAFAQQTAREVRARYSLSYRPRSDTTVGRHDVRVVLEGLAGYTLSYRKGYLVTDKDRALMQVSGQNNSGH